MWVSPPLLFRLAHISIDRPGTSGTACSLSDVDPDFDKGEFSNSFQEMIALITSYFPSSKPSTSSDSGSLIPWLDVYGNVYKHSPLVFLNLFKKLAAIHKEVDEKFLKTTTRRRSCLPLSFLGVRFTG